MPKLTIDGRAVEVAPGTNLIEAARAAGVEVPYFCYHPHLSVVGQCRICMVEIEGQPRLAIACATPVAEGMVVKSESSERAKEARAAVMEFLLINHPLDCPVCDQAGECLLQDHSVSDGTDLTNMVETRRTFPGYERRLIGPHIIQNQNRCIHCSRCIRFTQEISETAALTYKSRGNRAFIDTFNGRPFDDEFSGCAADVCPVGALTVREFRFRKRAWRLRSTSSVCPGCSIGCNLFIDHHERVVYRFSPRENPAVNATWLCDHGRFLAESLNEHAVLHPQRRAGGAPERTGWGEAIADLSARLTAAKRVGVVASANLSNEELYLARELFAGAELVVPVWPGRERRMKNARREWLRSTDVHPNAEGARRLSLVTVDAAGLAAFLARAFDLTIVLDPLAHPALGEEAALTALARPGLVVLGRTKHALLERAELILPVASLACDAGSFTSSTGGVQRFDAAFAPPGEARPLWRTLLGLARERSVAALAELDGPAAVFALMTARVQAFAGLEWNRLGGLREESYREHQHVG
jgi:NADH-quinone oxidoreductase subunit G